jgi:hypothetical protein
MNVVRNSKRDTQNGGGSVNAIRNHFLCAFAATLLAACGAGGPSDEADATSPNVSTASYDTRHQGAKPGAPKVAATSQRGAVIAGAATTQEAIDRALAANAATAAIDNQR